MSLNISPYIINSRIADEPIIHSWDDDDPELAYVGLVPQLQKQMAQTSARGTLALSAAFAEWIAYRFSKHNQELLLLKKIEAIWAGVIDFHYLAATPLPPAQDWRGPIRGAIWGAANWLNCIVDLVKRQQFAWPECVCLSQLILYTTPKTYQFKRWRRFAIQQLIEFYPKNPTSWLGLPLPKEVLNPNIKFDIADAPKLIDTYLKSLDPSQNPFLAKPAEMLANGFLGKPYTYSLNNV